MSHNKFTVAGQQPDSSGNVSVSVDNLSDTNFTSLSANEVVKWDGSQWINSTAPAGTGEYIQLGRGETYGSDYPFSVPNTANRIIYLYDTTPVNTISGATLHQSATTHWYDSITLPAGKYMIMCQTNVAFSQSGYLVFALKTSGNTDYSPKAKIGDNATAYSGGVVSTINYHLNLTSAQRLYLKVDVTGSGDVSATASAHNGYIDAFTYIIVVKV